MKTSAVVRVALYLRKICRVSQVDTQKIRSKLLHQLEGIFELAVSIVKGQIERLTDEEGKQEIEEMKGELAARRKR
jgi:hypothetical protein